MQNALAVGETREIIEKAELTTLKLRVTAVLQLFTVWPTIEVRGLIIFFGLTGGVDPGTREDD